MASFITIDNDIKIIMEPYSQKLANYIQGIVPDQVIKQLFEYHFDKKLTEFCYKEEE